MFEDLINVRNFPFNKMEIGSIKEDSYVAESYPIVYILYNTQSRFAYVGETTQALNRMQSHLGHPEKSKLQFVYIISSEYFNKSATLDIEANLIQYLTAAGDLKLLNGNGGLAGHNYYQRSEYFNAFKSIWKRLEFDNVKLNDLLELENSNIFKYSPFKSLSEDQYSSVLNILRAFSGGKMKAIFVDGSAGTGKTILAIYLIKLLETLGNYELDDLDIEDETLLTELKRFKTRFQTKLNIGLVVPMTSLRKTLKNVFKSVHGLSQSMVIGPTEVIKKEYDFLMVDESHRLSRRKSIQGYGTFDNVNKKLGLYQSKFVNGKEIRDVKENGTQLDWILCSSKMQLFFYDSEQSIKPADVRKEDFDKIKIQSSSLNLKLKSQLRSKGDNNYINFVDDLLKGNLKPTRSVFKNPNYELVLFSNLGSMLERLALKEKTFGLCRLMSGYCWPWVSQKNSAIPDAEIDGVKLYWNRETSDWINSTKDLNEMGCIHTVQGYDLNFAAVIFGSEITYDSSTSRIKVRKENYHDSNGKNTIKDERELVEYITKIYKTLMYRGILGTYVYVVDDSLRRYFSQYIQIFHQQTEDKRNTESQLRIVPHRDVVPFKNAIPYFDFSATAGKFSPEYAKAEVEAFQWLQIPRIDRIGINESHFVCQVKGNSMNKIIPDGSLCLFKQDEGGSRNGKIVLVELFDISDPDSGSQFTVKEYNSVKVRVEDGWKHESITLKPLSTEEGFGFIELSNDQADSFRIVGIFVCVL